MATVKAFVRNSSKGKDKSKIRFRLSDGRKVQLFHVSELTVEPEAWDPRREEVKAKVLYDSARRRAVAREVAARKDLILEIYDAYPGGEPPTSRWLNAELEKRLNPGADSQPEEKPGMADLYDLYLSQAGISEVRRKNNRVIGRALRRYELYRRTQEPGFRLDPDTFDAARLDDFRDYLRAEHEIGERYPELFEHVPEKRRPKPRGENSIIEYLCRLRTFCLWCRSEGYTANNPFENYHIEEPQYLDPVYPTVEERNRLYACDLSARPDLALQRDIWVLQSFIGCRVGDYYDMTPGNIVDGAVEYVPPQEKSEGPAQGGPGAAYARGPGDNRPLAPGGRRGAHALHLRTAL